MSVEIVRAEQQAILAALGFTPQQIVGVLEHGVTIGQLRGMLQLRQCEGAPVTVLAEIAARIDRLEQAEKLVLDSLAA
jgi:hypothetical protein